MIRIYDAAFASTIGTKHWHLATFWWIDSVGNKGQWTRQEAHDYVRTHAVGTVYVAEAHKSVNVKAYHDGKGTIWVQTEADDIRHDNLTTLAERHRQGLSNL